MPAKHDPDRVTVSRKRLLRVCAVALDTLARNAPGTVLPMPAEVGLAWLKRHVARLHERGEARFSVREVSDTEIIVTRRGDYIAPESLL